MGKASSRKKQRRAQGGRRPQPARPRRAPLVVLTAVVAAIIVGLLLLVSDGDDDEGVDAADQTSDEASDEVIDEAAGEGPAVNDHWHAAVGFYVCDEFAGPYPDVGADRLGIHTHQDGLIHIHPFVEEGAGDNATLGKFLDQIDAEISATDFTLPDGTEPDCAGSVRAAVWDSADDPEPRIVTADVPRVPLRDGQLITVAFVPEGAEIPEPSSAANLSAPGDV